MKQLLSCKFKLNGDPEKYLKTVTVNKPFEN